MGAVKGEGSAREGSFFSSSSTSDDNVSCSLSYASSLRFSFFALCYQNDKTIMLHFIEIETPTQTSYPIQLNTGCFERVFTVPSNALSAFSLRVSTFVIPANT